MSDGPLRALADLHPDGPLAGVQALRDLGVSRFEADGVKLEFEPTAPELPQAPKPRPVSAEEYEREQLRVLGLQRAEEQQT